MGKQRKNIKLNGASPSTEIIIIILLVSDILKLYYSSPQESKIIKMNFNTLYYMFRFILLRSHDSFFQDCIFHLRKNKI